MAVSITLRHEVRETRKGTVSLKFTAVADGISSKVFAIEVLPKSADSCAPNYRFSHVCSPAELAEFPEDEPVDNCYFRVNEVEFIFDTPKMVEHVVGNMKADVGNLVAEYNELESASPVTTVVTEF